LNHNSALSKRPASRTTSPPRWVEITLATDARFGSH
jgi:hypothetical protein